MNESTSLAVVHLAQSDNLVRHRWLGLAVLSLGLFMASLDNTILNVALPTLARDLLASNDELQWIVDSYQVSYAGMLLVAGTLVDRWGMRRTFLAGTVVFGSFSLMAGLSGNVELLITARTLMGLGAALLAPSTLALVSRLFADPAERTKAFAIWSLANGAGGAAGPLLSGILLEHFGWGAIFLINVPVAVLIVIGTLAWLPSYRYMQTSGRIDIIGAIISSIALASVCWAAISAPGLGIGAPLIQYSVIAGVSLLGLFIFWESKTDQPILRLELFTNRRFSVAVAVGGVVTAGGAGALFVLSQYLQFVLAFSPLATGVRVLPAALAMLIGALAAAKLIRRVGLKKTVLVGLGSSILGFLLLALVTVQTGYLMVLIGIVLFGFGSGLLVPAATQAVMDALPPAAAGVGSATNTALMQVGSALGVAVIGSVLAAIYRTTMRICPDFQRLDDNSARHALASIAEANHLAASLPDRMSYEITRFARLGFVDGMKAAMACSAGALILAFIVVAVFYPKEKRL